MALDECPLSCVDVDYTNNVACVKEQKFRLSIF